MTSISPVRDAAEHARRADDKTGRLEMKFINAYKGRGVFTTTPFKKGDFVVEYRGVLINSEESKRRRALYHSACAVYMFDFLWHGRWWCIDASQEKNSLGRLVNDDHINPNCTMKKILVDGKPHLCLFANKDINPGEEITYNYGGNDWPWREKVDKEPNVTEGVEVEHAGSSDEAPPMSKSSKKKVDKEPNVTEGVEVENAGSSDEAPHMFKSSKKKQLLSRSSPDSSSSDEDHLLTPKLRRTKRIQMNKPDYFESDDLSDSSSNESRDEYVPKSCEEYSEDTDTSEIMEIDDQKSLCLRVFRNIEDFAAVMEQNKNNSTNQGFQRGRSPTKKCKESQTKYKRRHFSPSSYHTKSIAKARSIDHSESSSEEGTSATSASVAEDNDQSSPSSSVVQDGFPNVPPLVSAIEKTESGSRIYNKRHYCLYCKKGFAKIARHLEHVHYDKPEVAEAIVFPIGSKQRKLHLEHLRNRGNFAHNVEVLNSGTGTLVPRKQPSTTTESQKYLHCIYCQGLFMKKILSRHLTTCKFKPRTIKTPGRTRIQSLCGFAVPPPPGVKREFWNMLHNMHGDEVYNAVKSDELIIEYGQHLYSRLGDDASRHEYIRQKLRELGRLLINSRKTTPMKTIEDHIKPGKFMLVVESVKNLAGFVAETSTYKSPSLALKIGHSLKTISELVESRENVQGNSRAARDAHAFRILYDSSWNKFVSPASLRTLQGSEWNAPQLLPFTKDVQTLHLYLSEQQQRLYNELSAEASPKTWRNLCKVTLTQVILFNRRHAREISKMPLSAYQSSNPSSDQDDLKEASSDLEKRLFEHFRRLEIKGKRGRKVPVLLTPEMQQSLDMLISKRQKCGVPKENIHLFARPSAMSSYRGSDCLRYFANDCGAKRPDSLTSTKLRKQITTLSQILNLSNMELEQLANFLGHNINVHRQFYRLPEGTLQLAKLSKVLMALEKGHLAEFEGKNLDDIAIDPEETVKLDSEEEAEFEADAEEDQVASTEGQMPDVDNKNAQTPSQAFISKSPKKAKGRQPRKRRAWNEEEIHAVEKHLMVFINNSRIPGKADCDKCLKQEPVALKHRNWLARDRRKARRGGGTFQNHRRQQLSVQHKVERREEARTEASRGRSVSDLRDPQCDSVFGGTVPAPRSRSSVRVCVAERAAASQFLTRRKPDVKTH
ncbi:uncharacterized protein LOC129374093 [Poeciliopsis prolifica]|uniref:uncharacterized protein LOC129374093 n=1 Tax=Poeciliopsis prolifica TaxID=188132 RepID=UPI0024138083|nr:uncharacterized protein LOC129374093 [Poeciliopsis prolifica]